MTDKDVLYCADAAEWRHWLQEHHADSPAVWLAIIKKGSTRTGPTYAEALDEALCFGWIDSQKASLDADFALQRFGPRGPRSIWSKRNVGHIERLEAEGRMQPAGLAAVNVAKANGRWDAAYEGQASAEVPPDLAAALAASPTASAFFATLGGTSRYAIIFRIGTVTDPDSRARKIIGFVEMLERGEAPYLSNGRRD